MENQNNNEYGQTDPDFIDQNTLVDGSDIQNETHSQPVSNKENKTEFGESDPDYIDQNTLVDNKTKSENHDQVVNKNDEITNTEKNNDLNKDNE